MRWTCMNIKFIVLLLSGNDLLVGMDTVKAHNGPQGRNEM